MSGRVKPIITKDTFAGNVNKEVLTQNRMIWIVISL
jgi:hypothetical protein